MRYIKLLFFIAFFSSFVHAQKADTAATNKSAIEETQGPPCEDCGGGGGDNISIEDKQITVINQDAALLNATILTSFPTNTVFTYYWKINNGTIQSGTATKAQLTNTSLYIGNLGLIRGQNYYLHLKVDYGGVTSLWDDLMTNFVYNYLDPEPLTQPTNMVIDSVKDVSMKLSWTAATSNPTGYLVLRKAGSAPTGTPSDGQSYSVNNTIGDGTVVYAGSAVSFTATGLSAGTGYYYAVFSYNGIGAGTNYKTASPLTANRSTLASKPALQPTGPVSFYNKTVNSMSLSWTAQTPAPSGYLVVRATSAVTGTPVDGQTYTAGNAFGNGIVVGTTSSATINATGLTANTTYYYAIYAYNGSGNTTNYCSAAALSGSQATLAAEPTAQPTALIFSSLGATSVTLSWTAASPAVTGYLIVRYTPSVMEEIPFDGRQYNPGETIADISYVVGATTGTSITASGLNAATKYIYLIYAYNGTGTAINYLTGAPLGGIKTTLSPDPTAVVTGLSFSNVTKDSMRVTFTTSGTAAGYIVLRKAGSLPTSAPVDTATYSINQTLADGSKVVSLGTALTFGNTSLTASTKYYYRIYSYSGTGISTNYSSSSLKDSSRSTLANPPTAVLNGPRFQNMAPDSMRISYWKTSGTASGYLIVRSAGAAPTFTPVNGTLYSTGQNVTSDTVAYVGIDTTFKNSSLAASTMYYYKVYSYTGASDSINYSASPISGNQTTMATAPTAALNGPRFQNVAADSMRISYWKTSGTASGYLIVRSAGVAPTFVPVNGTPYSSGQNVTTDTIAYSGVDTTFKNSGLAASTMYYYKVYSYNGSGGSIVYSGTSISGNQTTLAAAPTAVLSGPRFQNVSPDSMRISYWKTSGTTSGYLIVRSAGSAPSFAPVKGVSYSSGQNVTTDTVAYVGADTTFKNSGLAAGTMYYYRVYAYTGSGSTANYSPLLISGNQTTFAANPSTPGTVSFSGISTSTITTSWVAASGPPAGYLVVRTTSTSTDPVDGTTYTAGTSTLGSGTVVYIGTSLSYASSGLTANTDYTFKIYAYNGSGSQINYSSPVTALRGTLANDPGAGNVSNLTFSSVAQTSMTLSWYSDIYPPGQNPGYLVIRSTNSTLSNEPQDGVFYGVGASIGGGTVVYDTSTALTCNVTGLTAGTTYYFWVYEYLGVGLRKNYDNVGEWSASRVTMFSEPTAQPTSLTSYNITETSMTLGWTIASGSPTGYFVIRKTGSAPTFSPVDGTPYTPGTTLGDGSVVVGTSTSNSMAVTGLTAGTAYYFSVFSYNGSGSGINYRSASPLTGSYSTITYTISIQSPVSSVYWVSGLNYNIQWTDNFPDDVVISLKTSGGAVVSSVTTPSDGQHTLTVGSGTADGTYFIEVKSSVNSAIIASSGYFFIRKLVITRPASGAFIYTGLKDTITWTTAQTGEVVIELWNEPDNMGQMAVPQSDVMSLEDGQTSKTVNTTTDLPGLAPCDECGYGGGGSLPVIRSWVIDSTQLANGMFVWDIPSDFLTGIDFWYKLRLKNTPASHYATDNFILQANPLKVTSPNISEKWRHGKTYNFTWSNSMGGSVKVELYKSDIKTAYEWTVVSDTFLTWNVPIAAGTGDDYKIRISSVSDPRVFDWCDYDFVIDQPYVSVTSPNGGLFYKGDTLDVNWMDNLDEPLTLELKRAGSSSTTTMLTAADTLSSGKWFIPTGLSDQEDYYVKITGQTSGVTVSSSEFALITTSIQVVHPAQGQVRSPGQSMRISWNTNSRDNMKIELYKGYLFDRIIAASVPWNGDAEQLNGQLVEDEIYCFYDWTIPSVANIDSYKVRITRIASGSYSESNPFTITTKNNSIFTQTFLKAGVTDATISSLADHEIQQATAYSSGLGKLLQTISWKATPLKADIVTVNEYDILGLPARSFLPYVAEHNSGLYNTTGIAAALSFYNNPPNGIAQSAYPYSEEKKEKSPRMAVLEKSAPGETWRLGQGHTIKIKNRTNSANEVRYWDLTPGYPSGTTFYSRGELSVVETTDENGNTSITYTDKSEKTILKKSYKGAEEVLTYYVYDDYDNLKLIIPPEACKEMALANDWNMSTGTKNTWVTEFWYDGYQRLVEKKIPEAAPIYTVYDLKGRVVLTQDGKLKAGNKWMFTKYDELGRAILTGVYTDNTYTTRDAMQAFVDTKTTLFETRSSLNFETQQGYTNVAFPDITQSELWTVTYYDDYDFDANSVATGDPAFKQNVEFSGLQPFTRLKGKVTGTKTRVFGGIDQIIGGEYQGTGEITLESSTYLTSVPFYDKYGRVIHTQSNNSLSGSDLSYTEYDFPGKVLRSKTVHKSPYAIDSVLKTIEYDHTGRVTKVYQKNNTDAQVLITQNKYSELGTLIEKDLHSTNGGSTFLQAVNYSYNIRGWMTKINDPDALGSDKFAMALNYESVTANLSGNAQYNGNISQQIWTTDGTKRGYGYTYDPLNQLALAYYESGNNFDTDLGKFNEQATYDLNGNIQSLTRGGKNSWAGQGAYGQMDQLTYGYIGNKLMSVNDAVSDISENRNYDVSDKGNEQTFDAGNTNTYEYDYDVNGNMIKDMNKGIVSITYNYLNLPEIVDFGNNNKIMWVYAASGVKVRKTVVTSGTTALTQNYVSGFVYKNDTLQFFSTGLGRIKRSLSGSLHFEYDIKDNVGNVRICFKDSNSDGLADVLMENHYYPFGMRIEGLGFQSDNKFQFNGKELDDDFGLNWYEFGWRMYDPQLGRWQQIDPVDEYNSPYCYVSNSPANNIDPDGRITEFKNSSGQSVNVNDGIDVTIKYDGDLNQIAKQAEYMYQKLDQSAYVSFLKSFSTGSGNIWSTVQLNGILRKITEPDLPKELPEPRIPLRINGKDTGALDPDPVIGLDNVVGVAKTASRVAFNGLVKIGVTNQVPRILQANSPFNYLFDKTAGLVLGPADLMSTKSPFDVDPTVIRNYNWEIFSVPDATATQINYKK